MGVVPPRSVIQRVHTEMRGFAGKPVLENLLYVHSAEKIEKLAAIKSAEVVRCAGVIDTGVAPAYLKLILFFEGQLSRSTTDRGSGSCRMETRMTPITCAARQPPVRRRRPCTSSAFRETRIDQEMKGIPSNPTT
jgi:hypothetical protein